MNIMARKKWSVVISQIRQYGLTFRHVCILFFVFYILFIAMMVKILLVQHPKEDDYIWATSNDNSDDKPLVFYPRKMSQPPSKNNNDQCFYDLHPLRIPTFLTLGEETLILTGFFDERTPNTRKIVMLALIREDTKVPLYCLVYGARKSLHAVSVEYHSLVEKSKQFDYAYTPFLLTCTVTKIVERNPCKVYLSHGISLDDTYINVPLMLLNHSLSSSVPSIGVCLPIYPGVIPQHLLVEMIEFNRVLGADHIYLYHYQGDPYNDYSNPNVDQVLQYYQGTSYVTIYPWKLPISKLDIASLGDILLLHHCMYTNMYLHTHVMYSYWNEILVPHNGSTWTQMLQKVSSTREPKGICFPGAFFPPEAGESLTTQMSTVRTVSLCRSCTKCIVRPDSFFQLTINGQENMTVPSNLLVHSNNAETALVHMYHMCDPALVDACQNYQEDNCVQVHKGALLANYKTAMKGVIETLVFQGP